MDNNVSNLRLPTNTTPYRTLQRQTVHVQRLKLEALFKREWRHFQQLLILACVFSVIWPLAPVLVPLLSWSGLRLVWPHASELTPRDVSMYLLTALLAALPFYIVPAIYIIVSPSGFKWLALSDSQMNVALVMPMLNHLLVLQLLAFRCASHRVFRMVQKSRENVKVKWRKKRDYLGMELQLTDEQREGIYRYSHKAMADRPITITWFIDNVLKTLPGWRHSLEELEDQHVSLRQGPTQSDDNNHRRVSRTLTTAVSNFGSSWLLALTQNKNEDDDDDTYSLDSYAFTEDEQDVHLVFDSMAEVRPVQLLDFVLCAYLCLRRLRAEHTAGLALVLAYSLCRTSAPLVHNYVVFGALSRSYGPMDLVLFASTCVFTGLVSAAWLATFTVVQEAYVACTAQLKLVGSLASSAARHDYTRYVLSVMCTKLKSKEVLETLPKLDMSWMGNIMSFWRIREFALLAQLHETVSMDMAMFVMMLYLFVSVGGAVVILYTRGVLSALELFAVIDVLFLGIVAVKAVDGGFTINGIMESHAEALLTVRQNFALKAARAHLVTAEQPGRECRKGKEEALPSGTDDAVDVAIEMDLDQGWSPRNVSGTISVRTNEVLGEFANASGHTIWVLDHLIDRIERFDKRQELCFGVELTTTNALVMFGAIVACALTVMEKWIELGIVKGFDDQQHSAAKHVAAATAGATSRFFLAARPLH